MYGSRISARPWLNHGSDKRESGGEFPSRTPIRFDSGSEPLAVLLAQERSTPAVTTAPPRDRFAWF